MSVRAATQGHRGDLGQDGATDQAKPASLHHERPGHAVRRGTVQEHAAASLAPTHQTAGVGDRSINLQIAFARAQFEHSRIAREIEGNICSKECGSTRISQVDDERTVERQRAHLASAIVRVTALEEHWEVLAVHRWLPDRQALRHGAVSGEADVLRAPGISEELIVDHASGPIGRILVRDWRRLGATEVGGTEQKQSRDYLTVEPDGQEVHYPHRWRGCPW